MASTNHNFPIIISDTQQYLISIKNYLMTENNHLCKNIGLRQKENDKIRQAIKELLDKQKGAQYAYMDVCAELEQQAKSIKSSYDVLNNKLEKCFRTSSMVQCQIQMYLENSRDKLENLLDDNNIELQPYIEIEKCIENLKQENMNLLQNIEQLKIRMNKVILEDKMHYTEFKQLETCLLSVHMKQQMDTHSNEFSIRKMK